MKPESASPEESGPPIQSGRRGKTSLVVAGVLTGTNGQGHSGFLGQAFVAAGSWAHPSGRSTQGEEDEKIRTHFLRRCSETGLPFWRCWFGEFRLRPVHVITEKNHAAGVSARRYESSPRVPCFRIGFAEAERSCRFDGCAGWEAGSASNQILLFICIQGVNQFPAGFAIRSIPDIDILKNAMKKSS